jgi:hypothetical protein
MTQSYQHWAANLLAERASLLLLRPQNVIRWVRRVWGGNETPTTTITKYNPEDLRLSKCLWQLAVAKVKAFICSEFSHYRVVKTGKVSEFDDCEKVAIEDGKHTLLQQPICHLRGNSSQSSARSFSNLPQSTRICSSLTECRKSPPRTMFLTIQRTVCSLTRRTGTCKRSFHGGGLS